MENPERKSVAELFRLGSRELARAGSVRVPQRAWEKLGALGGALQSRLVFEWAGEEVAEGRNAVKKRFTRLLLAQLGGLPGDGAAAEAPRGEADFDVERVQVPTALPPGRPVPAAVQGRLLSKRPLESVTVLVDGKEAPVAATLEPAELNEQGQWEQSVLVNGQLGVLASGVEHRLGLRFAIGGQAPYVWELPFDFDDATVPCSVRRVILGPYDLPSERTRVIIDAAAFDAAPGDTVSLEVDGVSVAELPVAIDGATGDDGSRLGAIQMLDWVLGVTPGPHACALVYTTSGRRSSIWSGECHVQQRVPVIHLERVALTAVTGSSACELRARGWVENGFLVDCLVFDVDGMRAAVVGLDHLRPDIPRTPDAPLVNRQGFEAAFWLENIQPGNHRVDILATQKGAESGQVSATVTYDRVMGQALAVTSDDIERLERRQGLSLYASIDVRGSLQTAYDDVVATLQIDGRTESEQRFPGPGQHALSLRAVPDQSGPREVQVMVSRQGGVLYASNPARVYFNRIAFPADAAAALGAVVDRFELRARLLGQPSNEEILARLAERAPERIPELVARIRAVGRAVRSEQPREAIVPPPREHRRLKILFASWETPGPGHGGGVLLTDFLKRLGARHDITLVHTHGIDEVGHVDALRPHLHRVVSVPRLHLPGAYRGNLAYPLHNYENYVAELRRTMELELMAHEYDLVDYEYAEMGLYVVPGTPSVLTVHEVGHEAILNSAFARERSLDEAIPDLDNLLRNFHYLTAELPAVCPDLVMLTPEDAASVARFSTAARTYANPGGVHVEEGAPTLERDPVPVVAYVGNYQHPPNVDAALFFVEHALPELRRRYPALELHLFGPGAPARIQALDGRDGVVVRGFVEDLRGALRRATAFVAPIFTGAGQRIKVLEAVGAGATVIGTDLAMRGLDLTPGAHYYRANTASEFVEAVARVMENRREAVAIAEAGRDRALEKHGWERAIERREAIWGAVLEEAGR